MKSVFFVTAGSDLGNVPDFPAANVVVSSYDLHLAKRQPIKYSLQVS